MSIRSDGLDEGTAPASSISAGRAGAQGASRTATPSEEASSPTDDSLVSARSPPQPVVTPGSVIDRTFSSLVL